MRGFQPATKKPTKGGPVRGPGTGTSDDVTDTVANGTYIMPTDSTEAIGEQKLAAMGKGEPVDVQLSNGEFKIPPEQVHAVGVQALDQMKDATHAPVAARGFAPGTQQQEPPLFFANGGVVDEKNRRQQTSPSNIYPQSSPSAGANIYANAGFAANAPAPAAPPSAAVPKSQQIENSMQIGPPSTRGEAARQKQLWSQAQSAAANERYEAGSAQMAQEARDAAFARQRQSVTRSLAGPTIAPASEGVNAVEQWDASNPNYARPAGTPATTAPSAATPAAAPSANLPSAGSGVISATDVAQPPVAPAAAPVTTAPAEPQAAQVMPGVFRSGNSYSDTAANAIAGAQPRGLPSAQNMAAANALAQRAQQESVARIASDQGARGLPAPQDQAGWSGVIGSAPGVDRERQDLVSSLTTPLRGAQNGQLTAAQRNGMLQLRDQEARASQAQANNATSLQQTEMQGNTQREVAGMREAGDTGRAAMREAGEAGRANARNAIDQGRLGLDQKVRGFDIRAGQRQEKLYEKYDAAKTPEEKDAVAKQIRDLSGKAEPTNRFTVVPGGQEWDTTARAMRNVPGRVLNNQTGQFVEQGGAAQAQPAGMPSDKSKRVVGQTYTAPNGQLVRWTAAGGVPV